MHIKNNLVTESIICLFIFIISLIVAQQILSPIKLTRSDFNYYYAYYEPAILMACGKQMGTISGERGQALDNFISLKTSSFSCQDLPKNLVINKHVAASAWYYQLIAISTIWKITGIKWSAINYLVILLCAIAMCALYGVFRLGMGRIIAIIATLIVLMGDRNHFFLATIRDFGKVPFFYLDFLMLGVLVKFPFSRIKQLTLFILLGVVTGVGLSFRPDLLIFVPFVVITALFFLPETAGKKIFFNLILILLFIGVFILVTLPIFFTYQNPEISSCIFHFPLLGTSKKFIQQLGYPSPIYGWGYNFLDQYVYTMVSAYGQHFLNMPQIIPCSRNYDIASGALYKTILVTFPNDIIVRAYGAVILLLSHLKVFWLTVVLLLSIALKKVKQATFLLLAIMYFFAYPSTFIMPRHYFHLEIWQCWVFGYFINLIVIYFGSKKRFNDTYYYVKTIKQHPATIKKPIIKAIGFAVISFACLAILIWFARIIQIYQVKTLIRSYLNAKTKPLPYSTLVNPTQNKTLFELQWGKNIALNTTNLISQGQVQSKMMKLVIKNDDQCLIKPFLINVRYLVTEVNKKFYDYSHQFYINPKSLALGNFTVFMPIYVTSGDIAPAGVKAHMIDLQGGGYPFGIEIDTPFASCIGSISEVDTHTIYPMWLYLYLPANWENQYLYQRLPF